jgi:taurine dioxygenase
MVIWDNWRFIHSVDGHPPQYPRKMQRTTIEGDYGLGRLETAGAAKPAGVSV